MARKRIVVSSAGGIAAGSPFVLNAALFISQATPPVANTGRLARLADGVASIVAPGVSGPSTSFVLGPASDNRGAASTVIIGHTVLQTGAAAQGIKSVLIGGNIDPGAAATSRVNIVYIGWDFTLTDGGSNHGSNVFIGQSISTAGGTDVGTSVVIGVSIVHQGGDGVAIGQGVTSAFGESVVIGMSAINSQSQCVVVGKGASGGANVVSIGRRSRADNSSVAIGFFCDALGTDQVHVGRDISGSFTNTVAIGRGCVLGASNSIAIGRTATTTAANQCMIGSSTSDITTCVIGGGFASTTSKTLELRPSQGSGADNPGWTLKLAGGWGTGAATAGGIEFHTGAPAASSSTLQTLTKQVSVLPSAGGAAAPNLRFDNVTTGAGALTGTLLNAPSTGNPSFWLPISIAGAVRYIPCWT